MCLTFQLPLLPHSRSAFLPKNISGLNPQNLAIAFHIFMILRSIVVTGNGSYVPKAAGPEVCQCHCCQGLPRILGLGLPIVALHPNLSTMSEKNRKAYGRIKGGAGKNDP